MDIDAESSRSENEDTCLEESILATLLVSDWNVRAWMFLEAMRGRDNVHILCKNNTIISVRDIVTKVLRHGQIDLVILVLTSHHILRSQPGYMIEGLATPYMLHGYSSNDGMIEDGMCHLNHRHASRPGDDLVIWSLLCGVKVYDSPEEFWRARIGEILPTGFLLNSTPRIQNCPGFGWAQCQPTLPIAAAGGSKLYAASYGTDSVVGGITDHGFEAQWMVFYVDATLRKVPPGIWARLHPDLKNRSNFRELAIRCLAHFQVIAVLQPIHNETSDSPALYRSDAKQPLYALVASNGEGKWEWQTVFEWATRDNPLKFTIDNILLV
jgi:hypothetical protein